jgi:exoribonuclease R
VTRRTVRTQKADITALRSGLAQIEKELDIASNFPSEVVATAEQAAKHPVLPDLDHTDLPLVTIDPAGSMDLDQAFHIEQRGDRYRVYYAIADVAAFVQPGGPVDVEAHERGETLYGPDSRVPLHPSVLSEGAASLLPDEVRPALLWTVDLAPDGEGTDVDVRRARVRSRSRHDYVTVQKQLDEGTADDVFVLLQEVGELRKKREQIRGGISLPLPEQEIVDEDGGWGLHYRAALPAEDWNAQLSLLTGMGAAHLMMYGEIGLLRTLPPADSGAIAHLHRTAAALRIEWPAEQPYQDFIRSLDPKRPTHAAMVDACATLLRGAGYVAFEGALPEQPEHAGLASEYAHVTAPLRRLGDRYAGEICVALCAGEPVPEWVRAALHDLPKQMADADRRAHRFDRAVLDLVEAGVLAPRVGQSFSGVITDVDGKDHRRGFVTIQSPAVEAPVSGPSELPLGQPVTVTLVEADVSKRSVRFGLA